MKKITLTLMSALIFVLSTQGVSAVSGGRYIRPIFKGPELPAGAKYINSPYTGPTAAKAAWQQATQAGEAVLSQEAAKVAEEFAEAELAQALANQEAEEAAQAAASWFSTLSVPSLQSTHAGIDTFIRENAPTSLQAAWNNMTPQQQQAVIAAASIMAAVTTAYTGYKGMQWLRKPVQSATTDNQNKIQAQNALNELIEVFNTVKLKNNTTGLTDADIATQFTKASSNLRTIATLFVDQEKNTKELNSMITDILNEPSGETSKEMITLFLDALGKMITEVNKQLTTLDS